MLLISCSRMPRCFLLSFYSMVVTINLETFSYDDTPNLEGPQSSTSKFSGTTRSASASGGLFEIEPGSGFVPGSIDRISSSLLPPLPPYPGTTKGSLRDDELQVEVFIFL